VEKSEYKSITFSQFMKVLEERIDADKIRWHESLALLAVIGHNLSDKVGILAKIFTSLARSGVNVRTIYQSISECNVIIGVENEELTKGIKAVHEGLLG
jgi:aspartate kinase